MRPASDNTGRGADTRRFVDGLSALEARNNTTPTKNTRRPSRRPSRAIYATALYRDATTLDDLHEAVNKLEDLGRIARRVMGGVHPLTNEIEGHLQIARAKLRARELEHCD